MSKRNATFYIFKSNPLERNALRLVFYTLFAALVIILLTSLVSYLGEASLFAAERSSSMIETITSIASVYFIPFVILVILLSFNASFTLFSFYFTDKSIYKIHLIYRWKSRKLDFEAVDYIEAIPVLGSIRCIHLIFYSKKFKSLIIQELEWNIAKNALKKLNALNKPFYIRKDKYIENILIPGYDYIVKDFSKDNIQFNDKNYNIFIHKHPKRNFFYYERKS